MHILLLNEYYPPDTSATAKMAALVAETLAKKHQVTVLAGRPSYDPEEYYPFAFLRSDNRNNITVERVGSTDFPRHEMKRRVSNYLSYLALAVPRALAIRPDVVLAMTDPPVAGIAGAFIARMSGRPFVYNIRDMYPDMALGGDIVRANALVARWEQMHRRALRETHGWRTPPGATRCFHVVKATGPRPGAMHFCLAARSWRPTSPASRR